MTRTTWVDHEVDFNPIDYKSSMISNLKFYNSEVNNDLKKEWTLLYWKSQGKSTSYFDKIHSDSFAQLGVLVRILNRGYSIEPNHQKFIDDEYDKILARVKKPKPIKPTIAEDSIIDKSLILANEFCDEIETEFDQIAENGVRKYDIKKHLLRVKNLFLISGTLLKKYQPRLVELKLALSGEDKQTKEGYSHYPKKTIKLMHDFAASIIDECNQAKPLIKVRKQRTINIDKQIEKVKFQMKYDPLMLVSVKVQELIGAKVVYLFQPSISKLFKCVCLPNTTFTLKNGNLANIDTTKSSSKVIRKPEQFFQGINAMNQTKLDQRYSELTGIFGKARGQLNDSLILLKAF